MKKIIVVILTLVIVLSAFIFYINKKNISSNKMSALYIELNNVTLDEINSNSKEIKYKDNLIRVKDKDTIIEKTITIKGRGNTTWLFEKKPYQISFNEEINLFGLGSSKKWVLLANYLDETLLKNHIAFYLGKKLDMEYTSKGINVDLYIDNEYQGVYYLTPKIGITEASVNLNNDDGIVMELDNLYYNLENKYYVTKYNQEHFILKDVKNKLYSDMAVSNFLDRYNLLEECINKSDWGKIISLIDVESFAKYYILTSLSKNSDAYYTSFYMYQDGENDKIHAGPIWDFDSAFNIKIINDIAEYYENQENQENVADIITTDFFAQYSQIIYKLLEFSEFKNMIKEIWNKNVNNILEDIYNEIDKQYYLINESANMNIIKWDYSDTYDESISKFKENIKILYNLMDNEIKSY